jgi:hypothetical protein
LVPPSAIDTGTAKAIVPVAVIVPPVSPVPAVIEVTVPPLDKELIVRVLVPGFPTTVAVVPSPTILILGGVPEGNTAPPVLPVNV